MAQQQTASAPAYRGQPDKRRAILAGALTAFGRDGYTRASVDAIAAEAGVSTRTIYNHFGDKATVFHTLITESARREAEAQIAIIDRHLRKVTDLEADLIEFGHDWATRRFDHAEHFALVRQINAETEHIPPEAIEAWQQAGPLRVRAELARHLAKLAEQGLLGITDSDRAALHLTQLVSVANPSLTAVTPSAEEITATVTAGVRAFLYGYLPEGHSPASSLGELR
jgi:AcrR family transcriptional regulator